MEERDEKSEKSSCVFSLRANFFSSLMKNERNEKKQTRKKLLKIVQTTTRHRKKLYHLPSRAVPKNAQEEALGSDIASETVLDSPERRGGASS